MRVRFWGTRGSIATPGPGTIRYGGNTSCVAATTDQGTLLILDCGTGARLLGNHLLEISARAIQGHIFLTHTHWDHIQGFPFFAPVFGASNEFTIYGPADEKRHLEEALSGQMEYTYFPVELDEVGASVVCRNLGEGDFQIDDVQVRCRFLNHPALTLGYRLTVGDASVVYCTDHEPYSPVLFKPQSGTPTVEDMVHAGDRRHAAFLAGADLVIHDAQYTAEEYEAKRNWGHSSVEYAVEMALAAGVKALALFHHDPAHDDVALDAIEGKARSLVAAHQGTLDVFCAKEGEDINLKEGKTVGLRRTEAPRSPSLAASPRILVVDDDTMLLDLIRDILHEEGYALEFATDGEQALKMASQLRPDVILLDVRLPEIDGITVLERLRSSDATRELPVIMLTADDEGTAQGFQAGATDYMTKPFSPSHLKARLRGWIQRAADGSVNPAR